MLKIGILATYKKKEYGQFSRLGFDYINQIESTGIALPVIIPCNTKLITEHIKDCDAFIFPGGDDIDPEIYGSENKGSTNFHKSNDIFLLDCMEKIMQAQKPIFGICKGMQLINVYFGGTLIQDIPESKLHYDLTKQSSTVHQIHFTQDSLLKEAFQGESLGVNSIHHQVIDSLGEGLEVIAKSEEGYIEAVKHKEKNIIGVQWHPEMMTEHNTFFRKIFETYL